MTSRYEVKPIETSKGAGWVVVDEAGMEVARYRDRLNAAMRVLKEEQDDARRAKEDDGEAQRIWEARTLRV